MPRGRLKFGRIMVVIKMLKITILVFLFTSLFISSAYSTVDSESIIKRLEEKISGLDSLETDFIQIKKVSLFDKEITLKGKIFIQKPDLFSWHTVTPVRYIMVVKGNIIKQWDEDAKTVQRIALSNNSTFLLAVNQMKAWFKGEYEQLLKDYTVEVISSHPVVLDFFPKKGAASHGIIKRVRVTFRDDQRYIQKLEIEEGNDDYSSIAFINTKLDSPINLENWELK